MEIVCEDVEIQKGNFHLSADLAISSGKTTAVIGPSGGGKSMFLLCLSGFVALSAGRVLLGDVDMSTAAPAERPVTLLFQENNLFPHLTVFQNTALGINPALRLSTTDKIAVEEALEKVGLDGMGLRLPRELSGGQRQRVAIARAILRDKPLLMLDEPFAALGPALRHEMLDLVESIREQQGATLLLVTHNPEDALRIAEETVLVADGVVMPPQPTKLLLENPPKALAEYLGSGR